MIWLLLVAAIALVAVSVLAVRSSRRAAAERRRADSLLARLEAAEAALAPWPPSPPAGEPSGEAPGDQPSPAGGEAVAEEPAEATGTTEGRGPVPEAPAEPVSADAEAEGAPRAQPAAASEEAAEAVPGVEPSGAVGAVALADAQAADTVRVPEPAGEPTGEAGEAPPGRPLAAGAEVLLETLWALELARQQRDWMVSAAPAGGRAAVGQDPGDELVAALGMELERLREEVGVSSRITAAPGVQVPIATALVAFRLTQEILAALAARAEAIDLEVETEEAALLLRLSCTGWETTQRADDDLALLAGAAHSAGGQLTLVVDAEAPVAATLRVPFAA